MIDYQQGHFIVNERSSRKMINPQKPHIYRQHGNWQVEKSEPSITALLVHLLYVHHTDFIRSVHLIANQKAAQFAERLNQK
ncbi:hypothetical protein [Wielerella bovis]|uniref:hypothetical protein n=1 Tax=Wielerella bovis TaxID=2917790 RepID=UPI002018CC10|nr:hypothetical protein [Wielerella bovis]MCG7655913.1 hypothetical protein [Wielerella bovis]MCG7656889.1 hypothetical protein [Wielerella bovis]MCG7658102.1 hypothetical protein [Wielerella bovis]MCG7658170.1 hypothetical protein [Wielerella bovis]MCG7659112.1 hypothetical protein [Wielerella bovis]